MDAHPSATGPLARPGVARQLGPFAAAAVLAFATIPITPERDRHWGLLIASAIGTLVLGLAMTKVSVRGGSGWLAAAPVLSYFGVIAMLRHAEGGGASGFATLCLLPLFWLALYGTHSQLVVGFAIMTATLTLPIVVFGPPDYPISEWRRALIWMAVAPLVGLTTRGVVAEMGKAAARDERNLARLSKALDQLEKSEVRVRSVMDAASDGIVTIDDKARVETVNREAAEMFGYEPADVPGLPATIFWAPGNLEPLLEEIAIALSEGRPFEARERELVGQRRDGSQFPVEVNVSDVPGGEGPSFVAVMRDITERKRIQQMKDEFISVVSHELRTPLTSINGALGLLAGGVLKDQPDKADRMIEVAAMDTSRLMRLVNDMLDLERIHAGRVELVMAPVQGLTLIERAKDAMQALADEANVLLACEGQPISLVADEDRLLQVLTNLVGNAVKFSEPGAAVTLSVAPGPQGARFEVADQGRGIPHEMLHSVFERFQQVDMSDQRQKGGTGLGLAICKAIVESHGGRIWVESEIGSGSTFIFTIPGREPAGAEVYTG